MKIEYEYIYLNSRNEQIEIIKRDAPSTLKPCIQKAFNFIVGKGKQILKNDDIGDIVGQIYALAQEFTTGGNNREIIINLPEAIIESSESIKRYLPVVQKWRKSFFNSEDPPFPNDPKKASRWLINEEKKEEAPIKEREKENKEKIEALKTEIWSRMKKLAKLSLNSYGFGIKGGKPSLGPREIPHLSFWGDRIRVIAYEGTPFGDLEKEIRQISKESVFSPDSMMAFIFMGIKPIVLSSIHFSEMTTHYDSFELLKKEARLQTHRPFNKKEIERLYYKLKEFFGKKGKTFFSKEHLELYNLVEKHGGAPHKNKGDFWRKIQKEWNIKHPKSKFTSSNSPRIAYQRIKSRYRRE